MSQYRQVESEGSEGHPAAETRDITTGSAFSYDESTTIESHDAARPSELDLNDASAEREPRANRTSAHSFSNLPEVVPSDIYHGLHHVPAQQAPGLALRIPHDSHKEVGKPAVFVEHLPERYDGQHDRQYNGQYDGQYNEQPVEPKKPYWLAYKDKTDSSLTEKAPPKKGRLDQKILGIPAKWAICGLAGLVLLIIGLGAGLGAGLKKSSSKKTQDQHPQSGALNGTSISLVTQTFSTDQGESLVMYFQHWTGQIRWMQLGKDGNWTGGDASCVVANDAKNNTPISAVSYVWDGVSFWRVFYVDNTNLVKEIWAGNNTQGWALGPLSTMGISALDDDHIGLAACWDGPTSPTEYAEGYATTTDASRLVVRLIYASDQTTFKQLSYRGDTQLWTAEQTLPDLNAHATPACYNRGQGTVDYLMLVDLQHKINVFWRDTNTTLENTTTHPINVWTNASLAIPNVEPFASLGYTKYLYAQDQSDKLITAYSFNFAAENTTLDGSSAFVVQGNPGMPNTGLGVTARPDPKGGDDVIALYQTDGSHIGYYERDADGVSWTSANIVIPLA